MTITLRLGWKSPIGPAEWISLIVLFLVAGAIGDDPWVWSETHVFGVIYHYYTTHTWLIPINAGMPYMEKPPLYYWTGAIFCYLTGGMWSLPDAATMATVFYMLLTTLFLWKTSQLLFAARAERRVLGWVSIVLLLGQIGVVNDVHRMKTDIPLLAGTTITLYGLALLGCMPECWKKAGAWIGLGFGIAFMSKGLFIPVVLILAGIMLWCLVPALQGGNTYRALGIAFLVAFPFVTVWPALVYLHSPALFMEWFWDNNVGRFLGFSVDTLGSPNHREGFAGYLFRVAFPALPLACWAAVSSRRQWRNMEYMLPLSIFSIGLLMLFISATGSKHYFLPLLPCCALLAAPQMLRLPPSFMRWWNLLVRIIASGLAAYMWLLWWNLRHPSETWFFRSLTHPVDEWIPLHVVPPSQTMAVIAALLAVLFWLASFRLPSRAVLNTAYIWFAAVSLIWVTLMTLLLPWRDAVKSYRGALMEMVEVVRQTPGAHNCVQADTYNEDLSPMFQFIVEPLLPPRKEGEACPFLFIPTVKTAPDDVGPHWHLVWKGSRALEKEEELRLYQAD